MITMTIHRKIFKVKTVGSRAEGNLRPAWDMVTIMPGISSVIHEYNEAEGWCICECWGCDNSKIRNVARNMADLNSLASNEHVISVESSHALSPTILASISLSGGASPESVDREKKELVWKGKTIKYLRIEKNVRTDGKEEELFILDEG